MKVEVIQSELTGTIKTVVEELNVINLKYKQLQVEYIDKYADLIIFASVGRKPFITYSLHQVMGTNPKFSKWRSEFALWLKVLVGWLIPDSWLYEAPLPEIALPEILRRVRSSKFKEGWKLYKKFIQTKRNNESNTTQYSRVFPQNTSGVCGMVIRQTTTNLKFAQDMFNKATAVESSLIVLDNDELGELTDVIKFVMQYNENSSFTNLEKK